jgi:hypothetical protein
MGPDATTIAFEGDVFINMAQGIDGYIAVFGIDAAAIQAGRVVVDGAAQERDIVLSPDTAAPGP